MSLRAPTQADVAQRAGVSTATVSYVLSGRRDRRNPVTAETRQRVFDAVEELGYQRNHAARSLRRRRTELVCVVYRPPSSPWVDRLTEQLHDAAERRRYSVVTLPLGPADRTGPALRVLRERYVDGAIVMPEAGLPADELKALARGGLAIVVFHDEFAPDGFDVVRQQFAAGCRAVVQHLIDRGHQRIAHIAQQHELDDPPASLRYASYLDVLASHGLRVDDSLVVPGADSRATAYAAATELCGRSDRPTAVFCATDRAAINAIWAARDRGLSVPGDVAVASVGNTGEGEVIHPGVTSAGMPVLDFTASIDLLYQRIDAPGQPGRERVEPWELIVRNST